MGFVGKKSRSAIAQAEGTNSASDFFHQKKRAQAGTEYLMIAAFLLIIIGIAYLYSSTTLTNSVDDSKARNATNSIANAINQVYALGPGSKINVTVDLPNGVQSQIVENQLVGYITTVNGQPAYYYADTKANLVGSLPLTAGVHDITLTVNNSGQVVVGETGYGLFLTPKTILVSLDYNVGYNQTQVVNLLNSNPSDVGSIVLSKSGTASSLITIGSYPSTLASNTDANINVTITVPTSQAVGTYSAYLQADSNNGSDRSLIQIIVYTSGTVPGGSCTGTNIDTNWQTSWPVFDANMKTQYELINENNLHWHDGRYYTQAQSDANWNKYTLTNADINFNQLLNFPSSCPTGQAIKDINKTSYTCIPVGGTCTDTNWQTSWSTLDANLKATYPIKSDVNTWGDARYAPITSTSIIKIKSADQIAQNVNTSITGLDMALLANKHYGFHCYITTSSNAATVGVQLAMLTPTTPTYFSAKIVGWTTTTAIATTAVTASDTYQANTASQGTPNYVYEISGAIDNVNAGTLVPRFKSETASNVTIKMGSWCEYTPGA